jgi:hypothetical protein
MKGGVLASKKMDMREPLRPTENKGEGGTIKYLGLLEGPHRNRISHQHSPPSPQNESKKKKQKITKKEEKELSRPAHWRPDLTAGSMRICDVGSIDVR